jgi:hypothetical protein
MSLHSNSTLQMAGNIRINVPFEIRNELRWRIIRQYDHIRTLKGSEDAWQPGTSSQLKDRLAFDGEFVAEDAIGGKKSRIPNEMREKFNYRQKISEKSIPRSS